MVTSEARLAGQPLPDLSAAPGTPLHRQGWRPEPAYLADGPGKLCQALGITLAGPGFGSDTISVGDW